MPRLKLPPVETVGTALSRQFYFMLFAVRALVSALDLRTRPIAITRTAWNVGLFRPASHGRGHWFDPSTAHQKSKNQTLMRSYPAKYGLSTA